MKVGVVGIQGDVSEHLDSLARAMAESKIEGEGVWVRSTADLDSVSGLIIPGGESTTISKIILKNGLHDGIVERANDGMPVMGTCAGCVLMAKEGGEAVKRTDTKLLGLMDMKVKRNAFGRQRESFEVLLDVEGLDRFHAVFIRPPAIEKVWNDCRPLASYNEKIVMAQQGNLLGLAFHPELSQDTAIHRMFLEMVSRQVSSPRPTASTTE
jgi:5'-phosphate synthase pdxT subunit